MGMRFCVFGISLLVGACAGASTTSLQAPASEGRSSSAPAPSAQPADAEASKPKRDRLANPWLFDIALGQDSPEQVAAKIGLSLSTSKCDEPAPEAAQSGATPKAKGRGQKATPAPKQAADPRETSYCWREPGLRDVKRLRIDGYDAGNGPVASEVTLWHTPSAWDWAGKTLVAELGEPDEADALSLKWSWGHSDVAFHYAGCKKPGDPSSCDEVELEMRHWPTLRRSLAHRPAAAGEAQAAAPWHLDFGHDTADTALSKLQAAGFRLQAFGCIDEYREARSFRVRSCRVEGGPLRGLESATLGVIADSSSALLYELAYNFRLEVWDDVTKQLSAQYGSSDPDDDETTKHWWLGPVGVEVLRTESFFRVSYFHGRLRELSYKAMREDEAARRSIQKQGL